MIEKDIWDFFIEKLHNPYGVAALMGNLYVESKLKPTYLQSSYAKNLGMSGEEYTKAVDDRSYKDFIIDKAGYGLAQWTFWSRKEALYEYAKSQNASIGDLKVQLNYLWTELQGYKTVMDILCIAKSVREASDIVAKRYENCEHQDEKYLVNRAKYGQIYYDIYAGEGDPLMSKAIVIASSGKTVNLRTGAYTDSQIIAQVPLGTSVDVKLKGDPWSMIVYGEHIGFMMTKFLQFEEPSNEDEEYIKVEKQKLQMIYNILKDILAC